MRSVMDGRAFGLSLSYIFTYLEPPYILFLIFLIYTGETMVDCIFSARFFAYFALDLLMWRDYDVRDCDTEFRMWLVSSKFEFVKYHSLLSFVIYFVIYFLNSLLSMRNSSTGF